MEAHSSLSNIKENSILSIEMGPKSDKGRILFELHLFTSFFMIKEIPNPEANVSMEDDEKTLRNELLIQAEFTFFIFVNPTSGGNLAADFLELGVRSYLQICNQYSKIDYSRQKR